LRKTFLPTRALAGRASSNGSRARRRALAAATIAAILRQRPTSRPASARCRGARLPGRRIADASTGHRAPDFSRPAQAVPGLAQAPA
jgi:hypothetical protein